MFTTPKAKKELFLASSLCDGVEDNDIKQLTTLLDNKEADPNTIIPIYGITPFHLAIGNPSESFAEEVTKLFLRYGGNPNVRSIEGLTPVHIAAAWGRCNILKLLLSNGGDPLYLDNEGYSPFHFAFDGVHYNAVTLLRKCCEESTDDDEEDIKYDIALEKVLINNKNVVAEYVVTDEQTGTLNISPENILEFNIKSSDGSISSEFELFFNDGFVSRRRKRKPIQVREESKKLSETECEEKNIKEESINQLMSHLSTSATNITKTDFTQNSDSSLNEKRMQLVPKTLNYSSRKSNQNGQDEISENLISTRLKNQLKKEFSINKITPLKAEKQRRKSPLTERDINVLDNSILTKSPNCNILTRSEKEKIVEKTLFLKRNSPKSLDNSIITKSPNCAIASSSDNKRKLSKIPKFGNRLTPTFVKRNSSKIMSRTPCGLTSQTFSLNSQKDEKISKSLPKNFQNKISQRQELSHCKKKLNVDKKINSGCKKKDTEESSGIYSASSKATQLKNAAMKLDYYVSEDFDSLSNNNDVHSMRLCKQFERVASSSLSNSDKSLENATSNKSKFSSRVDLNAINSSKEATFFKFEEDSYDSWGMNYEGGSHCSVLEQLILSGYDFITNDPEQFKLSENKLEVENNVGHCENSFKGSKDSRITDDITERSFINRRGNESFVSIEEEYKYKDFEEGVVLMERRLCISPSCVMINKEDLTSFYTCSTAESVSSLPQEMLIIDKQTLRERLTKLGENPGPITNSTHKVYLKRLIKLENMKQNLKSVSSHENLVEKFEALTIKSSLISLNYQNDLQSYKDRETKIFEEFARPDPSRKWRDGLSKTCFNYLLLDSRITKDLPNRAANLSLQERWETFLSAIFYVGKGKQSRPYAHLYDAFHLWVSNNSETSSNKIKRILDIWNGKQGVVVLHIFHNTIPVEAFTREAAMIDALGVDKLANCKGGEYYGKISTWTNKEKCDLGKYLLYKAMEILMMEGERHLFPEHL